MATLGESWGQNTVRWGVLVVDRSEKLGLLDLLEPEVGVRRSRYWTLEVRGFGDVEKFRMVDEQEVGLHLDIVGQSLV